MTCEVQELTCYTEPMPHDEIASSFTNEDRRILAKVDTEIRYLKDDIDSLTREFRALSTPTKADFAELKGKVEALQNFRWYLMGIAVGTGALVHFLFGK